MGKNIIDLAGNTIVADEFVGASGSQTLPEIESTSESTSVGPGTLAEIIQEILDLIETKEDAT